MWVQVQPDLHKNGWVVCQDDKDVAFEVIDPEVCSVVKPGSWTGNAG